MTIGLEWVAGPNGRGPNEDGKTRLSPESGELTFEPLSPECLDETVAIARESFPAPWSEQQFRRALASANVHFFAMKRPGRVVGYCGYQVEGNSAHILSLAVHPSFRRQGIAKQMIEDLLDIVAEQGLTTAYLDVRTSNLAARRLYEQFGFARTRVERGFYPDSGEDAIVMTRTQQGG